MATAEAQSLPGVFRVKAAVPGVAGNEMKLDVRALAAGGETLDAAGELSGLPEGQVMPKTVLAGAEGIVLRRLGTHPYEEGWQWFLSEPVVALADLRAATHYTRTAKEDEQCTRCAAALRPPAGTATKELLSGASIAVE